MNASELVLFMQAGGAICELMNEAFERATTTGEHIALYLHVGDGETSRAVGFYNTAAAGQILSTLCDVTARDHVFGRCRHCDAVAMAVADAKRAYQAVLAAAEAKSCNPGKCS